MHYLTSELTEFLVSAKELYKELGIKKQYSNWVKTSIERAGLEEGTEFYPYRDIIKAGAWSLHQARYREYIL